MFASTQNTKTFPQIDQILNSIQSLYLDLYDKEVLILQTLKSTSDKLRHLSGKRQPSHCSSIFSSIESFHRAWQSGGYKISHPEKETIVFEKVRAKVKQFSAEFKELRKIIKTQQKDIQKLDESTTQIKKIIRNYYDPVVYYNEVERGQERKSLSGKFNEYLERKKALAMQKPALQKVVDRLYQLYQWFDGEIEEGVVKGVRALDKLGEATVTIIRQFFYYTIDCIIKEIQKMDKTKEQKEERRISITINQGESLQFVYEKYIQQTKNIIKTKTEEAKFTEFIFADIQLALEGLYSVKKYLEKQIFQINNLKQKLWSICPNAVLFETHRLALSSIIGVYDSYMNGLDSILQSYQSTNALAREKADIIASLKKFIGKESIKTTCSFSEFKISIEKELNSLDQIEQESRRRVNEAISASLNKIYEEIRQNDLGLSSSFKALETKEESISAFKLATEELKLDIGVNEDFEKDVKSVLEQAHTGDDIDKENAQKVYSCALGGKILLSGKLKMYENAIGFESVFNQKNLFFGTTFLLVPKGQIKEVEKQTTLLVANTLRIETLKGPLTFTSLFNRDKAFDEIMLILSGKQLNGGDIDSPKMGDQTPNSPTLQETPLDPQELEMIQKKYCNYDPRLEQPRSIITAEIKLEGLTFRQVFRSFFSQSNVISHKKKTYKNFKQFTLLNNNNLQLNIEPICPSPPQFFDSNSTSKLSQIMSSTRTLKYKHEVQSIPIPFMPKFGNCTQKQTFHWISNKLLVIESETFTTGIPYSDSLIVKNRTIVRDEQGFVSIKESADIEFIKSISLEKIVRNSLEKELRKSGGFIKEQIERLSKVLVSGKAKSPGKVNTSEIEQRVEGRESMEREQKHEAEVEELKQRISKARKQHRNNMLMLGVAFLVALALSRYI